MIGCIVIALKAPAATNGKPKKEELGEIKKRELEEITVTKISELL